MLHQSLQNWQREFTLNDTQDVKMKANKRRIIILFKQNIDTKLICRKFKLYIEVIQKESGESFSLTVLTKLPYCDQQTNLLCSVLAILLRFGIIISLIIF